MQSATSVHTAGEYDPSEYVIPCITTNGGKGNHWSGRRFTIRELAVLQGFPLDYHFIRNKGDIMRQIGNAIPPSVWEIIVKKIMKTVFRWKQGRIDNEGNTVSNEADSSSDSEDE
jgi:site-specific DNA-cytosine methylase